MDFIKIVREDEIEDNFGNNDMEEV